MTGKVRIETFLATVMAALLVGQVTTQVYANMTPKTILTQMQLNDQLTICGTTVQRNLTAERIDTFYLYRWYIQIRISGTVTVDGICQPFYFNTTKYPLDKLYQPFQTKCSSHLRTGYDTLGLDIPHYAWHGMNFLQSPGSADWYVEYDHLNNVDDSGTSGVYYDIPPNEGTPTITAGTDGMYVVHEPIWQLKHVKQSLNLWELITGGGSIASGIAGLLAALGLILINPIVAAIVAIVLAVLFLVGIIITVFVENILETETDDGWSYLWGYTEYWFLWWRIAVSWWMSFGRWRDWGWFFFIPTFLGGRCLSSWACVY